MNARVWFGGELSPCEISPATSFTSLDVRLTSVTCDPSRAHLVLAKLGIVHFLCLGGLWGQVRIGRALPWARKVELCLVDTLRDDVLITKAFREVGLSATYLHAAGVYRIQEHEVGEDAPKVEVVVFEEDAVVSSFLILYRYILQDVFGHHLVRWSYDCSYDYRKGSRIHTCPI